MQYSIPYLLYFLFLLVLAVIVHQRRDNAVLCRNLKIVGLTSFVLFFGMRGFIWHDWSIYYEMFQDSMWSDFLEYDYFQHREPGWMVFQLCCKSLIDSYQFMVFVHTLITSWLLVRFFRRYTDNWLLGLAVYVVFQGFVISINLLRNSMALFLFLNAIQYIEERRLLKYVGIVLLASMFHMTALLYLPLYFVLRIRVNRWVFLAIILLSHALLFVSFSPIMAVAERLVGDNEILAYKLGSYGDMGKRAGSRFVLLHRLITCLLVFCYYNKLRTLFKSGQLFINAFICYIAGMYLTCEFTEVSNRIGIIFIFSFWVLWIYLFRCFTYSSNRRLYWGFSLLFFSFYVLTTIFQEVCTYRNYLLGNVLSYEESMAIFNKTFKEPE